MKKFAIIIFCLLIVQSFSQGLSTQPKEIKTGISYRLYSKEHYPDENIAYSCLEMDKEKKKAIFDAFFYKITKNKKTENYIFHWGEAPLLANSLNFRELCSIGEKESKYQEVCQNSPMYYPTVYNFFTYKKKTIFIDDQKFSNGTTGEFFHVSYENTGDKTSFKVHEDESVTIKDLSAISFFEEWTLNLEKVSFSKEVKFMGASFRSDPDFPETPVFNFKTSPYNKEKIESNSNENLFLENVSYDVFCVSNILSSPNGVPENSFQYLSSDGRQKIIFFLLKLARENKIEVFGINENGEKTQKLNYEQISESTEIRDTIQIMDFDGYEELQHLITYPLIESYIGFRFYENWYFDKENFSIYKKVIGISLLNIDSPESADNENKKFWNMIIKPELYFKFN